MLYEQVIHTNPIASSFCSLHSDALEHCMSQTQQLANNVAQEFKDCRLPWLIVSDDAECDSYLAEAEKIKARYSHVLVLGMGGASLCGQVLVSLLKKPYISRTQTPVVHFIDTLDPISISAILTHVDPQKTAFLVISKSGRTIETLTQAAIFYSFIKNSLNKEPDAGQFIVITDPRSSPLTEFATGVNATLLFHVPTVGGRYSIFTNVGMLPAAIAGLDIKAICSGAQETLQTFLHDPSAAPIKSAAAQYALYERGIQQTVFMTYCDRLVGLVDWVRQLYAESLGKSGEGITPIKALGTMDQHSQLQLFLDGPKDKWFTVFGGISEHTSIAIDLPPGCTSWRNGLAGQNLSNVVDIEFKATLKALRSKGYPIRTFQLDQLDEKAIGALSMHFMLETILLAQHMHVDAYDQPAVEIGKRFAAELLLGHTQE